MIYNFCPKCGHKYSEQNDPEKLMCSNCSFAFYQNSKPAVGAIIVNEHGQLLLSKRKIDPAKGKWDTVGGFLNFGEDPKHAILREVKEETGLDAEVEALLGIFTSTYVYGGVEYATLNICYKIKLAEGILQANDDSEELQWFSPSDIPKDIANPADQAMIDVWLAMPKN